MKQMTFRQIEVLAAVLRSRGATAGAALLDIPQPNASTVLAKARKTFGDPLLVRGGRGMILTPEGLRVLGAIHGILDGLEALSEPSAPYDPLADETDFRIAAVDYVQAAVLPDGLAALRAVAAQVRLALVSLDVRTLVPAMEADEIDLAITTEGRAPPGLRIASVATERFACITRSGDVDAGGFDLDAFCDMPHILTTPTRANFRGEVDDALAELGRRRRVQVSASNFHAAAALVRRQGGVATLPARMAAQVSHGLDLHEPPLPMEGFSLVACWHDRVHTDKRHRILREATIEGMRKASKAQE